MTITEEAKRIGTAALAAFCVSLCQLGALAAETITATQSDIGKVIGANGKIYATVGEASSAGTSAYAMIAYVNVEEGRGLAMAVNDISNGYVWDDALSAAASWSASRPVEFGRWRLPTVDDLKYMFQGCGGPAYSSESGSYGYGKFRDWMAGCGGTAIGANRYWTSDEKSSTAAWQYNFWSGRFDSLSKTETNWARCCLEFEIESDNRGRTGECRWKFDAATGILTIYGNGAMADYVYEEWAPWHANLKTSIAAVVIESGVVNVGDCAFYECSALADVSIPGSVTNIGDCAFFQCGALKDFAVPQNLVSIGYAAFYSCEALTGFTLPATVESIGEDAFRSCPGITDVYCHPSSETLEWGDASLDFKEGNETLIHVRSGQLAAYRDKFGSRVRGAFTGDLPYDSYARWAEENNIPPGVDGIRATPADAGTKCIQAGGGNALIVYVDPNLGTGFAIQYNAPYAPDESYCEHEPWQDAVAFTKADALGVWRLPTMDELERIFVACHGGASVLYSAGGEPLFYSGTLDTFLDNGAYWTSTESEEGTAYVYNNYYKYFHSSEKESHLVRLPVLEFKLQKFSWEQDSVVDGVANAFLYAFGDATGDFGGKPLLDIGFGADGKAVVKTPKVVNTAGFTYSIVASDDVSGCGNVAAYPLSADGETSIDEVPSAARFFRLTAEAVSGD